MQPPRVTPPAGARAVVSWRRPSPAPDAKPSAATARMKSLRGKKPSKPPAVPERSRARQRRRRNGCRPPGLRDHRAAPARRCHDGTVRSWPNRRRRPHRWQAARRPWRRPCPAGTGHRRAGMRSPAAISAIPACCDACFYPSWRSLSTHRRWNQTNFVRSHRIGPSLCLAGHVKMLYPSPSSGRVAEPTGPAFGRPDDRLREVGWGPRARPI